MTSAFKYRQTVPAFNIFGWDENIYVVALLPLGYPAEEPAPRKRLTLEEILL